MLWRFGLIGAEPAGAGDGLVEGGVDAAVGRHLGQQRLAVGRPQLLDLAVAQQGVDDRVLAAQLLEGLGVGREARLGLLLRGQAQLVEQHLAQLRGRVDDELRRRPGPGSRPRAGGPPTPARWPGGAAGPRRPGRRPPPSGPAPGRAAVRPRRRVCDMPRAARAALSGSTRRATAAARRAASLGGIDAGPAQVELAGGRAVGRPQLEAGVAQGQVLQQVLVTGRVDAGRRRSRCRAARWEKTTSSTASPRMRALASWADTSTPSSPTSPERGPHRRGRRAPPRRRRPPRPGRPRAAGARRPGRASGDRPRGPPTPPPRPGRAAGPSR